MRTRRFMKATLRWFIVGMMGMQLAHAGDVITVDSVSDQPEAGLTTLREAIDLANSLSGAEIVFDSSAFSTPQTITMVNGEFIITRPMQIIGPGADLLTIDGNNQSRIFTLDDGNAQGAFTVTISGITFTNGNSESALSNGEGGCIQSNETLILMASVVKNCSASLNGGGVHTNRADNVIENTLFLNNTTEGSGGGMAHQSSVNSRIIGSTFTGNTADVRGGAIHVFQTGSFDVINSTITSNQASTGAGISSTSTLTVNNSTIVDNLGEGVNLKQDNIQNSIVAGNTEGDCVFSEIGFNNLNNLDTDGSCGVNNPVGHITVADPMLEPLAYYGGPTLTRRPLPGSSAIDRGDDFICAEIDQRGELRPQDGNANGSFLCDIGAVELTPNDDVVFKDGFDLVD